MDFLDEYKYFEPEKIVEEVKEKSLFDDLSFAKKHDEGIKGVENAVKREVKGLETNKALDFLDNLKGVSIPKEIGEAEFLETGLNKVVNKNTFLSHLKSKSDANTRLKHLNLIEPTLQEADIKLNVLGKNKEVRNAYLKAFQYDKNGKRKLFFTLITEQDDSYLITAYPINKIKEVKRIIKNAKSVEYIGRPTEALGTATEKNASSLNESISQIENKIKQLNTDELLLKQKQLEIISKTNPHNDSLGQHTWIRKVSDIKTFDEVYKDIDKMGGVTPDYTLQMAKQALKTGKIKVYSSYPIENGVFVTPSRMEAQNYAGNGRVYEKVVNVNDVAWIDAFEGQFTKLSQKDLNGFNLNNFDTITKSKFEKGNNVLNNDLQRLFLSENNYIDYDKIKIYAKPSIMPKPNFKNYNEFKAIFTNINGNIGYIDTPYMPVKVKIYKAYEHFTKNTNNKNRENIKGGFFSTLQEPLFIVRSERVGQKEPSIYFYKPFLSKNKEGKESVMNIFSIAVDYNGNLDFKTYYHDERNNRLKNLVENILKNRGEVVYIKSPNG